MAPGADAGSAAVDASACAAVISAGVLPSEEGVDTATAGALPDACVDAVAVCVPVLAPAGATAEV